MKAIILTFISALIFGNLFGNDEKFVAAMQKHLLELKEAKTMEQFQTLVNSFERIGNVETKRWEPLYYSAFGYLMMCNLEKDGAVKDSYIDRAQLAIKKAMELAPAESEIVALEGFAHMLRVTVDPAGRGAQFSGMAVGAYQKALAMNAENPRALALLAQMQLGTARFFGSSTEEACQTAKAALAKFDTYRHENPLAPGWGRNMAEKMIQACQ